MGHRDNQKVRIYKKVEERQSNLSNWVITWKSWSTISPIVVSKGLSSKTRVTGEPKRVW